MSIISDIATSARSYGIAPSVALALAASESGFDPNARGDEGCSYGIFQINTCAGHPAGLTISQQINYALSLLAGYLRDTGGNIIQAFALYKGGRGGASSQQAQAEARAAAGRVPEFSGYDVPASGFGGVSNTRTAPTSTLPGIPWLLLGVGVILGIVLLAQLLRPAVAQRVPT